MISFKLKKYGVSREVELDMLKRQGKKIYVVYVRIT
jgi:hypothetical protein